MLAPTPDAAVPARDEPALRLRDVHRRRGRTDILRGVDLTARAGAVTVLLGPNGAGKSTTLGLCHGTDRPDAGTVRVFGADPWRAPAALRARIGVMWQEGGLPPSVSARRFVGHVASLYRSPSDPEALLERLLIADIAGRPIRRLSGGQRQRVALAAAVVGNPDLLFLDEPTSGLDPETRPVVHEVIREHTARGAAVLLTTHLLDDAERLADDVAILRAGRVVRTGTLAELTRVESGDVVDVEFAEAAPQAVHAWARALPAPFAARRGTDAAAAPEGSGIGTTAVQVTGVRTPAHLHALAATWAEYGLLPTRWDRASLRLERVLQESGQARDDGGPDRDDGAGPTRAVGASARIPDLAHGQEARR